MPGLRLSIRDLRVQLQTAQQIAKGGRPQLAVIAATVNEEKAREEELRLQQKRELERRRQIAVEAVASLAAIFKELEGTILAEAPNAEVSTHYMHEVPIWTTEGTTITLGKGAITFRVMLPFLEDGVDTLWINQNDILPRTGYLVGLDGWHVLAGAYIATGPFWSDILGLSANLWLARMPDSDDYKWWEISYVTPEPNQVVSEIGNFEPFGIKRIRANFSYILAKDPLPVTPEFVEEFINRWIDAFTTLASGDEDTMKAKFPRPFEPQHISPQFLVKNTWWESLEKEPHGRD